MNKPTSLLHSVVAGLAAILCLSALPSARAQSLTVDFASDRGAVTRPMQGYLYSWWHTRESPRAGNLELNPNSWRLGYWGSWDYEYQPMVDQGIEHLQVILTDAFRNRAHTTVGGYSHDYTWQNFHYTNVVAETVKLVNSNNWDKIAFDLINEPDAFGIDGIGDWYREAWVPAFRIIRQLRPQAQIVGPGFFSANLSHLNTFLSKAKADNVVPDIISQHLLDNQSRNVVENYTAQIRALLTQYGLAQRPISFNEYINPGHIGFVEDVVDAICQGERAGVHSAMHSSWDDSGELPPWNSTGDAACFDGVLSIPQQRERACYWTYKFYGDLAGRMVYTSGSSTGWDGVASVDANTPVARVLMGGSGQSGNVTLTLNNVPASFGSSVNVHIERVTSNGNDLTAAPTVHSDANYPVSAGTATIAISGVPARAATMVTIRPAGLPAKVATPTFSPRRGVFWKPTTVTLASSTPSATIRYTLDGSVPTGASPAYSAPIYVPVTTTIRAIATKSGMPDSEIANGTFTIRRYDNGVFGEYFGNATLSGTPTLTRGDGKIDFNYGGNRLDASLPYDNFSVRWTGRLRPYATGTHQLRANTDDGVRLYVDNNLVIDNWGSGGSFTVNVNLVAGQDHDVRMEFNEATGNSVAQLFWTPPGGTESIIPTARLFPPTSPAGTNLLIGMGTAWKYLAPLTAGGAPAVTWKDPSFNDTAWSNGVARVGFGGDGEVTTLPTGGGKPMTVYFRRTFNVPNPAALAAFLDLALVRDDGAVVYLNGTELFRDNLPTGAVTYATAALGGVGNSNESTPVRKQVPRALLLAGNNTLAVEIHNSSPDNEDLGFDCSLSNPTNNTPPVIGPIASRTALQGVPIPAVGFSVWDGELSAVQILVSATSANQTLIPNSSFVFGGIASSRTVSFTPAAGQTGTTTVTVSASDAFTTNSTTFTVNVIAPPANTAPTISDVTNRTIVHTVMSDEIYFTIGDAQTDPGLLTVTASSANQTLIANSNLFINGTANWRTLSIKPNAGQGGTAVITLTVSDGSLTASDTFTVTVSDPPPPGGGAGLSGKYYNDVNLGGAVVLTRIEAVNFDWGGNSPGPGVNADNFSVRWTGLVEAPVTGSYLFRTVTDDGVRLWIDGTQRINDWNGHASTANTTAAISLTASNKYYLVMEYFDSGGGAEARLQWQLPGSSSFVAIPADRLFDTGGNTPPTITDITDRTIAMNANTGPIAFTIGDAETAVGSLTLSSASSNPALVPNGPPNLVFGGSGASRTVTVTPLAGQFGGTYITVTVTDGGGLTRSDSFALTVTSGAAPLTYNFDTGTLQSWTDLTVTNSNTGPRNWAISPPAFPTVTYSGAGAIGQNIVGGTQDSAHPTLRLRSPTFMLNGAGSLTAWLRGGTGSGTVAGTAVAALPANTTSPGFQGIALRDANTGNYVLAGKKSSSGDTWQQAIFTAPELATLPQGHVYTLDLIDAGHGGWGWVAMDSVSIPGTIFVQTNTPPVISDIPNQSIPINTNTGPFAFTIGDAQTPATNLTLSAASSNTNLVPVANIVFGGSGSNRTVTVSTRTNTGGSSIITVTVSDGNMSTNDTFTVSASSAFVTIDPADAVPAGYNLLREWHWRTGGDLEGWTANAGFQLAAGTPTNSIIFGTATNSDPTWSSPGSLNLTPAEPAIIEYRVRKQSTDTTRMDLFWSDASGGFGGGRVTTVQANALPQDDQFHVVRLQYYGKITPPLQQLRFDPISDAAGIAKSVSLDYIRIYALGAPANTAPTITDITDRTIGVSSTTGPLAFTVGDTQTAAGSLTVTASSGNPTLVPNANVVLGGSGASRTVTVTPAAGLAGTATIAVAVSDGSLSASDSFQVTVSSTPVTMIAEDHFLSGSNPGSGEYAPGPLAGQGPTLTGWSGAWTKPGYAQGNGTASSVGLRYPGLAATGGKGSTSDGLRVGHLLAQPFTSSSTGTYYLSVVLMLDSNNPTRYRCLELHDAGYDDTANRQFQLGQSSGDFGGTGYGYRVLNTYAGDLGPADTAANLFVLKFDFSTAPGGDGVTLWRNPTDLGGAEPAGGTTVSGLDLTFDRISFADWQTPVWETHFDMHFDELRLASTWAEVTPVAPAPGSTLTYDFEDGTLQGWSQIMTNNDYSPQYFEVADGGDAQAGARSVKQHLADTWPGFADLAHQTLWVRSPEFKLNGSGNLTFWIFGGGTNTTATPPANESQVPANSVDTANGGWHGLVLRKVATGDFVLIGNRTTSGTTWEQVTFNAAQLAALDQNAVYTLDAIDARNNANGWFNFDSVTIPGTLFVAVPTPPTLTIQPWTGHQLRLSWPSAATGYSLQKTAALPGGWGPAGLTVTTEGAEEAAYAPASASAQFYRLMK